MFVSALQPAPLFEVVLQAESAVPFEAALQRQVSFWQPEQRPKAPGMKYRHYAPRGRLTVVSGTPEAVAGLVNRLTEEALSRGENPAVLASSETAGLYRCKNVLEVGSRAKESEIAHSLFAMLRRADELEADPIFAEEFDTPRLGGAVMNRLMKAAGFHRIKASE